MENIVFNNILFHRFYNVQSLFPDEYEVFARLLWTPIVAQEACAGIDVVGLM